MIDFAFRVGILISALLALAGVLMLLVVCYATYTGQLP